MIAGRAIGKRYDGRYVGNAFLLHNVGHASRVESQHFLYKQSQISVLLLLLWVELLCISDVGTANRRSVVSSATTAPRGDRRFRLNIKETNITLIATDYE